MDAEDKLMSIRAGSHYIMSHEERHEWLKTRRYAIEKISEAKITIPTHLPFLEAICWQTTNVHRFNLEEMLSRYERGWRYRSIFNNLDGDELEFVIKLAKLYQSWILIDLCD